MSTTPSKIPITPSTTITTTPSLQTEITHALLQNGGVGRIQAALQQRLDEAGWTEALRAYATQLFRSGEAGTFEECLVKVLGAVKNGGSGKGGADGRGADGGGVPDLRIPGEAKEGGAGAVRRELEGVLEMGGKA